MKKKLVRITTVPGSLGGLLQGQLNFMNDYYDVIGVSATGNSYSIHDVQKQENIRVIPVEMSRKINLFQDFAGLVKLFRVFLREKPDIVHTHTPKAGLLGMIAAYITRVPHRLHTVAGMPLLEVHGTRRKLLDIMEKITYFCATKIYPNSFGLRDIIIKNGYSSSKKVKVIGNGSSNGIDTEHFNPNLYSKLDKDTLKESIGIEQGDFVFLFVGRLVGDKGINELVNAFNELSQDHADSVLVFVGKFETKLDPLKPETLSIIESNDKIIPVGWQNDVRPYFAISNALVFPSYREGFPNAVLQSAAMGLKSIVSDINGCNEIIENGTNGLIVPPKDEKALYGAMLSFLQNKNNIKLSSEGIRNLVETKYKRKVIWQRILEEYEALVDVN